MTGTGYRIHVGDAQRAPISVVRAPQFSVVSLTLSAAIKRTRLATSPASDWRAPPALMNALRPASGFALTPILRSGLSVIPDVANAIVEPRDTAVPEHVDALRSAPHEALVDDLAGAYDDDLPDYWAPAADRPARWLDSMATAVVDTWRVVKPSWQRAAPLLGREIERVGTARVRGAGAAVLDSLHSRVRFADGWLTIDSPAAASYELGDRQLVLVPMLVGSHALIANFANPQIAWLGYPLPGYLTPARAPGADPLSEVLGEVRAEILRTVMVPMTAGALGNSLQAPANTVTYHATQLERAGLISRERRGRSVRIAATQRGRELIDLLAE